MPFPIVLVVAAGAGVVGLALFGKSKAEKKADGSLSNQGSVTPSVIHTTLVNGQPQRTVTAKDGKEIPFYGFGAASTSPTPVAAPIMRTTPGTAPPVGVAPTSSPTLLPRVGVSNSAMTARLGK